MVWNNTVSFPGSPWTSNGILKTEAEEHKHREWLAVEFIQVFLAGYTFSHERYNIDIYIPRTTNLLTPNVKSFVTLKVLIQNERTRWFTVRTSYSAFVQGIVRVGYSPSLLLLCTLGINQHLSILKGYVVSEASVLCSFQPRHNLLCYHAPRPTQCCKILFATYYICHCLLYLHGFLHFDWFLHAIMQVGVNWTATNSGYSLRMLQYRSIITSFSTHGASSISCGKFYNYPWK